MNANILAINTGLDIDFVDTARYEKIYDTSQKLITAFMTDTLKKKGLETPTECHDHEPQQGNTVNTEILIRLCEFLGMDMSAVEDITGTPIKTRNHVPICQKTTLTVQEAASYSGIGERKLREMTDEKTCTFVMWNGSKRLIKRKQLDEYIAKAYSV